MSALSAHAVDAIRRLAADMPTPQSALLSALRMAQSDAGHVGSAQVQIVAEVLGLTPMQVEGVARFYDLVTREPTAPGRLRLCTGVVCVLRGASAVDGAMAAARGGDPAVAAAFTYERAACLGHCDHAPAALWNDALVGPLFPDNTPAQLTAWLAGEGE